MGGKEGGSAAGRKVMRDVRKEGRKEEREEIWMDGAKQANNKCQKLLLFSSHTTKLALIQKLHPCIAMAQECERSYLEEMSSTMQYSLSKSWEVQDKETNTANQC